MSGNQYEPVSPAQEPAPSVTADVVREQVSLRTWPLWIFLIFLVTIKLLPMAVEFRPWVFMVMFMGPVALTLLILIWLFAMSRATWREKSYLGALLILGTILSTLLSHVSIRGFYYLIYILPYVLIAFSVSYLALQGKSSSTRVKGVLLVCLLPMIGAMLIRTDGMYGDFRSDFVARWVPTSEETYLASRSEQVNPSELPALAEMPEIQWSEFRGKDRNGIIGGITLNADWDAHPPKKIWERSIGPGWGSFALAGPLLYTQEQRGDREGVVCLDAASGEEGWFYSIEERFFEPVAGAGPRATPTLHGDSLFTLGASGALCRLDALRGTETWRVDIKADAQCAPPMWGFAASPLVVDDLVIVHAGGPNQGENKAKQREVGSVLAYGVQDGKLRWTSPSGSHSYASPQLFKLAGQRVILMNSNFGLHVINPVDGGELGNYEWPYEGYRTLQPLVLEGDDVLLGTGLGGGTQRLHAVFENGKFQFDMVWESNEMKPDFNDWVAHEGKLFGFDHVMFTCLDLETGKRIGKKGRYGNGQVLLLAESGQLLVLSEKGELVLLETGSFGFKEVAKIELIEGKTWNHPVLVGKRIYVRNGEKVACYEFESDTSGS